ncbi:MAG: MBOAT family protein [Roseivirga sp.]
MLFNSLHFLGFFLVVFFIYWSLKPLKPKWQNLFILIASYFFYGVWDWRFLLLIILSSTSDFLLAKLIEKGGRHKKRYLTLSILLNLSILAFFKYFNFFIDSLVSLVNTLGYDLSPYALNLILPVGISFYTFQTMSYCIDVSRGRIKACHNPLVFFSYVCFFPQLVAGPIERAEKLLPQFESQRTLTPKTVSSGLKLMLWGFFLKIAIADRVGIYVDSVYDYAEYLSNLSVLLATFFFGVQIYCDFAGYSLIAIGIAKLLGFELTHNFNKPYLAKSHKAFWSRWHITLSNWFRDYVYIPLGGNRKGVIRTSVNLLITFALSGLWHGASWNFVLWGIFHALFLILEKATAKAKLPALLKGGLTFICINLLWVFFRSETLDKALLIYNKIIHFSLNGFKMGDQKVFYYSVLAVLILVTSEILNESKLKLSPLFKGPQIVKFICLTLLIVYIITLGVFDQSQFIYFQF